MADRTKLEENPAKFTNVRAIKEFFELPGKAAVAEIKALGDDDKKELGDACRRELRKSK